MATKAVAPAGLARAGGRLWRDVVAPYDLRVDELRLLEAACRTADTLARLEEELKDAPLTVAGSMGQLREHPLLAEARMQRGLLAKLLGQLKLPDAEDMALTRELSRSRHASHAAQSRWGARGSA